MAGWGAPVPERCRLWQGRVPPRPNPGAEQGCGGTRPYQSGVLTLAHYTSAELIEPRLRSRATPAVLAELCSRLERCGRVEDPLAFYNAVVSHERLGSSAVKPGWALPHARIQTVRPLCFALGRSGAPLDWLESGQAQVRLVFLFAVPRAEPASYLSLLGALARLSCDSARAEALLQAPDPQAMYEVLEEVPVGAACLNETPHVVSCKDAGPSRLAAQVF